MKIGFISTRLAGVDGVSLEAAKLAAVLREAGHEIFYCAGELGEDAPPGYAFPEMHFAHPTAEALHDQAFSDPTPPASLYQQLYASADIMREQLDSFIHDFGIELLIPQNALTIPMNISLGLAITEVIKRRQLPTLNHNHDFYWERERFITNGIQDILDEAFPPKLASITHLTISTVMQRRLKAMRGIQAHYMPNVFDFENPPPPPDDYALGFRADLGLSEDDLIVLQPTRVIRRKAIEKAIELVRKLDDPRLVLLITGYESDERTQYGAWLREEAERAGIRYQFIGERVGDGRGENQHGKIYALWDIYPHAHFISYPSVYEGFGNALIETLYFRKPLVVHTYPQYVADIKSAGVRAVEFYHDITEDVVTQTRRLIDDAAWRDELTTHNYQVGLDHFSYRALRHVLNIALSELMP